MKDYEGSTGKDVEAARTASPTSIALSPTATMDLAWLPDEERKTILKDYTHGILDISRKAQELHVEVATLQNALRTFADTTQKVAQDGNSVTISHTHTTSHGETKIMMGNTPQAGSGNLTNSQTGERNWTPYYIFGGLLALVLIAALVAQ